jgi:hypothetical protein
MMLVALQHVIYERPPPGTLQRGLVALPRWPTTMLVLVGVVAMVGWYLRERYRSGTKPR